MALMAVVLSVGFSACGDKTSVTGKACDVSATSATFIGYVNLPPTELTTASFGIIWGTQKELNWDNKAGYATSRELETNKYTVTIHDLVPETKYFYRSYVCLNGNTYLYGAVKSFRTAQPENLMPYALWCEDNATLYFIGSDYTWKVGNTHNGKTITAVWHGDDIAAQSTYSAAWDPILNKVTHVVFEESFKKIKPKCLMGWFSSAKILSSIDGLEYLNTSEATDMGGMFSGCNGLTSLDVSNFDTRNVTNMNYMFSFCSNLTSLNVSHFNTQNVMEMVGMFVGCSSLTTIYCNDTWSCQESDDMFSGCISLVGAIAYDENKTDVKYANPDTGYFTRK